MAWFRLIWLVFFNRLFEYRTVLYVPYDFTQPPAPCSVPVSSVLCRRSCIVFRCTIRVFVAIVASICPRSSIAHSQYTLVFTLVCSPSRVSVRGKSVLSGAGTHARTTNGPCGTPTSSAGTALTDARVKRVPRHSSISTFMPRTLPRPERRARHPRSLRVCRPPRLAPELSCTSRPLPRDSSPASRRCLSQASSCSR